MIEGILKKRKSGDIVANRNSVLGSITENDVWDDDIIMVSDGVLCDITAQ